MTGGTSPIGISERGFTLVELLVVLVIVTLALAALPVAFNQVVIGNKFENEVTAFRSALKSARSQAITLQQPARVEIDSEKNRYRTDANTGWTQFGGKLRTLPDEPAHSSAQTREIAITFHPDGSATGETILLRSATRTRQIEIDWLTGELKETNLVDER